MFDRTILDRWLEQGLCYGKGDGVNTVCVEQAVSLALGYPLTDEPEDQPGSCIDRSIATMKRGLNDLHWSSMQARAEGLRELAYEQIGSLGIDMAVFKAILKEKLIRRLVSKLIRTILPGHADACERLGTDAAARAVEEAVRPLWTQSAMWVGRAIILARTGEAARAVYAAQELVAGDEYPILACEAVLESLRECKTSAGLPLIESFLGK